MLFPTPYPEHRPTRLILSPAEIEQIPTRRRVRLPNGKPAQRRGDLLRIGDWLYLYRDGLWVPVWQFTFPSIAGTPVVNNDTTGTSHTVGLPTGITAGELLVVIFASDGAPTVTWPSGWDQAANNLIATTLSTDVTMAAKQRVADGSEGASITVTTSVSEWTAWVTLRITGWHGTTAAEAGTATGSSANANPPSLNPANWDVEDTLWIATACNDTGGADNDDITAHPASYTGIGIALAGVNAGGVCLAASQRNNAVAAEDPGTYTAPTTEAWVAATIGIRPAAGGGGGAATYPAWFGSSRGEF